MRKIDLNLFRVFDAVMRQRSVSAASRELDVTASAVSHALSRLRKVFDDELFIFGDLGMEPTARALELAPTVQDALRRLAETIDTEAFAPERSVRTFALACTDNTAVTVLPKLVAQLLLKAPQVSLRVFPFSRMDVVRQLDDGRLDLVLGWFAELPDRTRRTTIYTEQEAMVVRSGHPLTQGEVTKKRLFEFPHVVVELSGSENQALDGFVDERGVLRRVWIERLLIDMSDKDQGLVGIVAVTVPHYASIPPMLEQTDLVATLPRRLAVQAAQTHALVLLDLPYDPLVVPVEAIWHSRGEKDTGLQWLIHEVRLAS